MIGFQFLNIINISHQGYFTDKQSLKLYKYTNKITVGNKLSQNIYIHQPKEPTQQCLFLDIL